MGEAAGRFSMSASGQSQQIAGQVAISASETFAVMLLPEMVSRIRREHPGVQVEIIATDAQSDLRRREADVAVRNVRPEAPDLIAKKVRDMRGHLYAASSYLDAIGRPNSPAGLSSADFVGWDRTDALIDMLTKIGFTLSQANFPVVSASHLAQWEMVKRGMAIGVMAEVIGDAEPRVERALPDLPPIEFPVWLVSHRELHTSRRVRAVFDLLVEAFAEL